MAHIAAETEIDVRHTGHFAKEPRRLDDAARERILAVIETAQNVDCEENFKRLFRGRVNELIPHQIAACGIGDRNKLRLKSYINIGFPESYLRSVIAGNQGISSPVIKVWTQTPIVRIFNDLTAMKQQNPHWGEIVEHYGIQNMLVHGLPDIAGENSSYFCLAQCPKPITKEHSYLMELITPHLHNALLRATNTNPDRWQSRHDLTTREHEIFRVMCQGHTNKEIATMLGISGNTVRNHVCRICKKLGVANRTMAVVKANGPGNF